MHQEIAGHVRPDQQCLAAIPIRFESFQQAFRAELVAIRQADERLDDPNERALAAVGGAVEDQEPLWQVVAEQRQPGPALQQVGIVRLDGGINQFVQEARTLGGAIKGERRTVAGIIFRCEPAELNVAILQKPDDAIGDVDVALLHLERIPPLNDALERRHHRVQPRLGDLDFQRELLRLPADFQNPAGNDLPDVFRRDDFPEAGFIGVAVKVFFVRVEQHAVFARIQRGPIPFVDAIHLAVFVGVKRLAVFLRQRRHGVALGSAHPRQLPAIRPNNFGERHRHRRCNHKQRVIHAATQNVSWCSSPDSPPLPSHL